MQYCSSSLAIPQKFVGDLIRQHIENFLRETQSLRIGKRLEIGKWISNEEEYEVENLCLIL